MVKLIVNGGIIMQVNVQEAKTGLSRYIRMLETKQEKQIIIARHGKPVVKLTAINDKLVSSRIGIAAGKLQCPEDLDQYNDEVATLFGDKT